MTKRGVEKGMSIREASDFWDEHEFGEFDGIREVHDVQFALRKKKYIGIDTDLYEIIREKAHSLNTSEEAFIRECVLGKTNA